jgi:hypothetical protein
MNSWHVEPQSTLVITTSSLLIVSINLGKLPNFSSGKIRITRINPLLWSTTFRFRSKGWIVMPDQPDYPDKIIARVVTDVPTPYILLGHTLAEVQVQLLPDLQRSERQPSDPPGVVEVWLTQA